MRVMMRDLDKISEGIAIGEERGIAIGEERGIIKGIAIGKEEGRLERNLEIAKSLITAGMSIANVSLHTGLSVDEINSLTGA